MVSFSCEVCNDTVIKKKLDQHRSRCPDAYYTCIDCSTTFNGVEYRSHTQCISEAEKYEKGLYKGKKHNNNAKPVQKQEPKPVEPKPSAKPVKETKTKSKSDKKKSKTLDLTKYGDGSLYKIVKAISSDTKKDKKDVLKSLNVKIVDGKIVLTPN
ncbi:hypothetical protein FT663_02399 [Candidozyma haemuli var. vulneris]|uniref:Zinc finger C2H2 LYAR-type domain-containing protein n=1 Tax=Candidozyma haemuli TaxID=45357 RepID=A0A2V1B0J0_9ASCO|nr:hypothetical protein CXQ85_002912 [[Candida] haemuloni]KAF3988365.1 hypothetical protein FT662_03480 [[Candida] haemuloni var. vulneris]KAF3992209.1 hypothetical protein FT663_02399 [[Candida] haemuloni var. vulneris]PVH23183.1 hypothetical protein CXQ85_002912 [[Candida] haemuloni]